jgi:hypothetical protein
MNIKSILIIFAVVFLSSCSKEFLDRQPESSISPGAFFRSEKDLELYTNSFYQALPVADDIFREDVDNIVKQNLPEQLTGKRIVPVSGGGWSWDQLRNINYFLENYNRTLPEEQAKKWAALAKFFRAYFYFDKVQRFGDVPWYSHTLNPDDEEDLKKARDPRTLVMDSVMADIDYAIANLGTAKSVEKVTKWTALALKSRIALFEGTFRKYHSEFSLPDSERFLKEAALASKQLINEGPYSIFAGSGTNKGYLELFASVDAIDQEVILTRRYSYALQIVHMGNYHVITASQGRPGLNKELVNSYLMKDGSRFTDRPGYETLQFYDEVQDRDPRLSQTIRTPGYMRIGGASILTPRIGHSITGYQPIKFVGGMNQDSFNEGETDMPIFRFGEVLLNYAEAMAELGEITQADIDISIKKLRDRVGMPNLDLAFASSNPDPYLAQQYKNVSGANQGIILEVRRERRIELVMESFRWNDLMRWKEGHLLTRQFKGMYFPSIGKFDFDRNGQDDVWIYEGNSPSASGVELLKLGTEIILENGNKGGNILVNPHITKVFDEAKDYLFPLPIQELQLNPNLKQNPGWGK